MKFLRNRHTGFEYPYIQTLAANPDFILVEQEAAREPPKVEPKETKRKAWGRPRKAVSN